MNLCFDYGVSQLKKHGEELCGDSVEIVRTEKENIIVMSDGLGSGVRANILSRLTAKTASTMLKMGGNIDEVIDTVAKTLPISKNSNLAYSTFSILQLHLDGRAYLVEYDNPPFFTGHQNKICQVRQIETIIGSKKVKEYFFELDDLDWVVLISDGVLNPGSGGLMDTFWGRERIGKYIEETYCMQKDAGEWAEEISSLCNSLYEERPGDDATVVVIKARTPDQVTMLIGPPKSKENDYMVVQKLMTEPGIKIVSGGTTGNVVGRILGREVTTDLTSLSREIPPTGLLPGIDLLTEGAVTLVRALEYLKRRTKIQELKENKDGASRLATMLAKADSIHMLVGTATNGALHGADLPAIYTYKSHVVRDLINVLQLMSKEVTVEYY